MSKTFKGSPCQQAFNIKGNKTEKKGWWKIRGHNNIKRQEGT